MSIYAWGSREWGERLYYVTQFSAHARLRDMSWGICTWLVFDKSCWTRVFIRHGLQKAKEDLLHSTDSAPESTKCKIILKAFKCVCLFYKNNNWKLWFDWCIQDSRRIFTRLSFTYSLISVIININQIHLYRTISFIQNHCCIILL